MTTPVYEALLREYAATGRTVPLASIESMPPLTVKEPTR